MLKVCGEEMNKTQFVAWFQAMLEIAREVNTESEEEEKR